MSRSLRPGKPYIWVTWLAKLLGGDQCAWSAWFKAHYRYEKFEEQALDLAQWNREHTELMQARKRELLRDGWTVTMEQQNAFRLEGAAAVVAGKIDIIATKPGFVLVVDGKTGRERDSDLWQVLIYLFALPKCRPDLFASGVNVEGEVQYRRGDERITVTPDDLTPQRLDDLVRMIKAIGSLSEPPRAPSREECQRCNIGVADCPQRIREHAATLVADF